MNDEYVKVNEQIRRDYSMLLKQNEKLIKENADLKLQQLKVSKPFVDLTGDDSDVEIVEEKKKDVKIFETPKSPDIIHIKESNQSETKQGDQLATKQAFFSDLKNSDIYESYEDFEKFILDQI